MSAYDVAEFPLARKQSGTISREYEDFCAARRQLLVAFSRVLTLPGIPADILRAESDATVCAMRTIQELLTQQGKTNG